jgi:hypothetical protein
MYEDELEDMYYADPEGVTRQVVAEAAAIGAQEIAAYTESRQAAELQRLRSSQSKSAALTAIGETEGK